MTNAIDSVSIESEAFLTVEVLFNHNRKESDIIQQGLCPKQNTNAEREWTPLPWPWAASLNTVLDKRTMPVIKGIIISSF